MALITYTDGSGHAWRVWNVTRETLLATRTDYLDSEFRDGWLVFQREGTDERRRLGTYPDDWSSLRPAQLEGLCERAQPVAPARAMAGKTGYTGELPRFNR